MPAQIESPLKTLPLAQYAMHYLEQGQGAPLLLVHGSLCDCRYWKPQMALGASYRVIAVSLRRYWPERWDGAGGGFSVSQHAQDLAAFIEALDAGPAHVLGHSRGGSVALELARRFPARVRTLALADPGAVLENEDAALAPQRQAFRERALALIRSGDLDGGLALFIDTVSGAGTWRQMVSWFKQMTRDNAATLIGQVGEPRGEALDASLAAQIGCPTLLLGGAGSPAPYPQILDRLQALLPQARRHTVAHASHGMNLGNPRDFNAALASFLAG